ncbi:GDSL-type esterase/lipase family protein [Prosthecobacter dejongeii]|uniref:Lysophospholipase L1-like esterase n=1 Tax=Prosthecobacter dejongeii TaxID=48465 RepID=A0A7W7YPW9_9BACT|nr:GDSL-type esterase/lipase family protein [Prosthecobacter dejongeii]MBB5040186.1 lysophospholipase L1-like esterase [Prosthecobacter dejongeii]
MKPALLLSLLLATSCLLAQESTPRPDPQRFAKEITAFAEKPADKGGIVFTGSSSIRLWKTLQKDFPGLPVLNRGFGGSVANDLIVHFDTVVARHEPKLVVTYTGSNDINAKLTPQEALADYTRFLDLVHTRLPQTRVIVTSVKIGEKRLAQMPQVHELNRLLQAWIQGKDWVRYVDTTSYLADEKGHPIRKYYVKDLLHLSPEGYAMWTKLLTPVLKEEWAKVNEKKS